MFFYVWGAHFIGCRQPQCVPILLADKIQFSSVQFVSCISMSSQLLACSVGNWHWSEIIGRNRTTPPENYDVSDVLRLEFLLPVACAGGEWADGEGGLGAGNQDAHRDATHRVWQCSVCLHTVWVQVSVYWLCIIQLQCSYSTVLCGQYWATQQLREYCVVKQF